MNIDLRAHQLRENATEMALNCSLAATAGETEQEKRAVYFAQKAHAVDTHNYMSIYHQEAAEAHGRLWQALEESYPTLASLHLLASYAHRAAGSVVQCNLRINRERPEQFFESCDAAEIEAMEALVKLITARHDTICALRDPVNQVPE